ncbi:MAG TPA: DICT sensory domain-containing protein [Baekduia sp.]|uniref:DICT sensory domain-containing protein n=1 Tax=Baekduia sp. TaxID=2600305 RepID=UPI002D7A12D4|nr:DICT sensory domain-containing protein [Baekduia sp.]HET6506613.1 DICT sensory domain-containing protein [Baekduia sp.]
MSTDLAIKDVAERTGIAAGTIRMWEQRYGFPVPERTPSGYRRYTEDDVDTLRKVIALRQRGLSVPAAISRAQDTGGASDHPSIYAAVAAQDPSTRPHVLRKRTLIALSRAIEHEALALAAAPVVFAAFQEERFYRDVEARYRRLAAHADAAAVFADFPGGLRHPDGGPVEIPVASDAAMGNEWAVIVDAPGYAACLLAWEQPDDAGRTGSDGDRRFEAIWTIDPEATRRAAQVAARLAGRADPAFGDRLGELLTDRPLALDEPAPALSALTNRIIAYLDGL